MQPLTHYFGEDWHFDTLKTAPFLIVGSLCLQTIILVTLWAAAVSSTALVRRKAHGNLHHVGPWSLEPTGDYPVVLTNSVAQFVRPNQGEHL